MENNINSRRQFLIGLGHTLAIPFLPSLLPRELWAQTTVQARQRFFGIQSFYGQWKQNFLPPSAFYALNSMTRQISQARPGGTIDIYSRPLTDLTADISPILRHFNNYKTKMTILKNFAPTGRGGYGNAPGGGGHNSCVALTGCDQAANDCTDQVGLVPDWGNSIDQTLSYSPAIYPGGISRALGSIVLTDADPCGSINLPQPSYYSGQKVDGTRSAKTLWDTVLKGPLSSSTGGTPVTVKDARVRALNAVFSDYQNARSPRRNISASDTQRLDAYMQLLNEVAVEVDKQNAPVVGTSSCAKPSEVDITNSGFNRRTDWEMRFKLVAAAFACGVSSVAAARLDDAGDSSSKYLHHDASHLGPTEGPQRTLPFQEWIAQRIKVLVDTLESIPDVDGRKVLDNSVVFWGNELGYDSYGSHATWDSPLVTFGSAGGRLRAGNMIVAKTSMNANYMLSYNSVLEAIMSAMNVTYPTRNMATYGGAGVSGYGAPGGRDVHIVGGPLPFWKV